jgi:hypothetical protein
VGRVIDKDLTAL